MGNEEGNDVVKIKLGPGQNKLVELKATNTPFKVGMGMKYGIA